MAITDKLKQASRNKQDEFYTQLSDIEKEMKYYKNHFKDKIIFCNCDDPEYSNFWKYFELNFSVLGLKKLVATHYETDKPSYKLEINRDENGDGIITSKDIIKTPLKQNGDFRSPECIEILKESDIIITNPPFSLFREYIAQLMEYDKKFLILGNQNAITYKEFFPLIMENKVWLGASIHNGDREFRVPKDYDKSTNYRYDEYGNKYVRVRGPRWFTNLDYPQRHENIILYREYNENDYPKYDNYDAINIDNTKDIPMTYKGVMGVPITFIDKYSPDQFKIIGLGNSRDNFTPNKDYINPKKILENGKVVNGGAINCVLTLAYDEKPTGKVYYTADNTDKYLLAPYARILITFNDEEVKNEN